MNAYWNLHLTAPLDQAPEREALLSAIARAGGTVRYAGKYIPWVSVRMGNGLSIQDAMALPGVLAVEDDNACENCPVAVNPQEVLDWTAPFVGAEAFHTVTRGDGVRVALIDTGLMAHPELDGMRLVAAESFVPTEGPEDAKGHGGAVLGLLAARGLRVLGVAPDAEYVSLKAMDNNGSGQWSWVAAAVERAIDYGCRVANLSLGGPDTSLMLEDALAAFAASGGVAVAAAGNNGHLSNALDYPARSVYCIAAGAVNQQGFVPPWSQYGPAPYNPDCVAPGVQVACLATDAGYASYDGTSFATAVTSGLVALLFSASPGLAVPGALAQDPKFGEMPQPLAVVRQRLSRYGLRTNATLDQSGYGLMQIEAMFTGTRLAPPYALLATPSSLGLSAPLLLGALGTGVALLALGRRSPP